MQRRGFTPTEIVGPLLARGHRACRPLFVELNQWLPVKVFPAMWLFPESSPHEEPIAQNIAAVLCETPVVAVLGQPIIIDFACYVQLQIETHAGALYAFFSAGDNTGRAFQKHRENQPYRHPHHPTPRERPARCLREVDESGVISTSGTRDVGANIKSSPEIFDDLEIPSPEQTTAKPSSTTACLK